MVLCVHAHVIRYIIIINIYYANMDIMRIWISIVIWETQLCQYCVSQSILSVYSDVCMSVWTAQYDVSNRHRQCILSGGVRTGTPEHSVLSSESRTVIASYQQSLCMIQSQQREPAQQREYFPRVTVATDSPQFMDIWNHQIEQLYNINHTIILEE